MPFYFKNQCTQCSFSITCGEPGVTYVISDSGDRVVCPHVGENSFIAQSLHISEKQAWNARYYATSWWWRLFGGWRHSKVAKLIATRTGKLSHCVCSDMHEFKLDYEKDRRICPVCSGREIKRVVDLEGEACPCCRKGHIEKIFSGSIT